MGAGWLACFQRTENNHITIFITLFIYYYASLNLKKIIDLTSGPYVINFLQSNLP